ncbi:MAG: sulfite exporter TauE/SafE family protein, partial [Moraxellaceae bacterium]
TGVALGAVAMAAATGVLLRGSAAWCHAGIALVLVLGGWLLTPVGQWLARGLPALWLHASFAALMLYMAWRLWREARGRPESVRIVRAWADSDAEAAPQCALSASGKFEWRLPCVLRLVLVGALVGLLSGLYGVGGGFIIVPMLVLLTGLPMAQAVSASLLVITAVAGGGFLFFLAGSSVPAGLWPVAAGAIAGMVAGSLLARHVAGPRLQQGFALLMVALAVVMLAGS